jgi:hypothetical protein
MNLRPILLTKTGSEDFLPELSTHRQLRKVATIAPTMGKHLSEHEFRKLLHTDDPFRLAVRGHVALEGLVEAGLEEALGPDFDASLRTSLDIANRLGLLTQEGKAGMEALGALRNSYAHGVQDSPDPTKMSKLVENTAPLLGELERVVRAAPSARALQIVLLALHATMQRSIASWRVLRDEQDRALKQVRAEQELTLEEIEQILKETDDEADG